MEPLFPSPNDDDVNLLVLLPPTVPTAFPQLSCIFWWIYLSTAAPNVARTTDGCEYCNDEGFSHGNLLSTTTHVVFTFWKASNFVYFAVLLNHDEHNERGGCYENRREVKTSDSNIVEDRKRLW